MRRGHRRLTALLVAGMVTLAACSASDNGGVVGGPTRHALPLAPAGTLHSRLPGTVAGRGVLRVGSSVDRPPLLFYGTGTTVPEGIEWDLLQSMGRQLGVSVSVVNLPLGALGPDLVGGKIDMFVSGVADLKPLEGAGIDFVDYFTGRTAVLVRQGNPVRITGADDLCGRQVGVVAETAQQVAAAGLDSACRTRGRPALVLRVVADHAALLALLVSGRVQADLDDAVVAAYTAQGSAGPATMEAVGTAVDPVPYGIGVLHSDPQLTAAIQAAVRSMIADGEYDEILSRWGGETSALHTAAVDAGPSGL